MAKLTKKAAILDKLHSLVEKEAALAQTNVSGVPGTDTNFTSISESTETTDKNNVGPDKLNGEQKYEQKPATDESEPVASAKTAGAVDVEKLASDILASIQEKMTPKTAANAQTNISGKPGKDTEFQSVSDKTETTDKNSVGPDKLNNEQEYEQKPSTDPSKPVATAKTAEELNKEASYKLGATFAEALIKRAALVKQAEEQAAQASMIKEAGRRDFEALIQQAALEIKTAQEREAQLSKQAEEQGAFMFEQMLKQAKLEAAQEEVKMLTAKLAEYAAFEKEAQARYEAQQREEEFTKLANVVVERLKNELSAQKQ